MTAKDRDWEGHKTHKNKRKRNEGEVRDTLFPAGEGGGGEECLRGSFVRVFILGAARK